jgi:hypothetical protein
VTKVDGFDRSTFYEGGNIDISIFSKKIKIMLPGHYSQDHLLYSHANWIRALFTNNGFERHICLPPSAASWETNILAPLSD